MITTDLSMIEGMRKPTEPPDAQAVSAQEHIYRFQSVAKALDWNVDEWSVHRLLEQPTDWPMGRDQFRILRIRLGYGEEGVRRTFLEALRLIAYTFGANNVACWRELVAPDTCIRLHAGNETHVPVLEFDTACLNLAEGRTNVEGACSYESLADELLFHVGLFPELMETIMPALFAGGYQFHVPDLGSGEWRHRLFLTRDPFHHKVLVEGVHIDHPELATCGSADNRAVPCLFG